jgi:xanthine dehydrogenase YagS FAD-binding subunit
VKDFEYRRAESAEQAMSAAAGASARFIAGGTLLVDLLRLDIERPDLVVDINGLDWNQVEERDGGVRIGALVKNSDLAHHPLVQGRYRVLSEALLSGASPQVRNMASVGGNLLQRTRCSYFRDVGVSACNKRNPGSGCAAREGYSRMHAVLGGSQHCIAAHPSDMNVALAALDATLEIEGPNGKRELPMTELHTLPGEHPEIETVLAPGELISHVRLPEAEGLRSAYVKARDRASFAFALASAAAVLELDGRTIRRARVAFGGVGAKPWRSLEIERALAGQPATREAFERVAPLGFAAAQVTPHNAFKVQLARHTLIVALERAAEQA